ncbi:ATP-binding cassette domain-containing protein [Candidatus Nitrosocosmicus hydrocola]|uniref:ATP-binding cassette domain-containing protein n=1 Tax=Candidatus Nitrosocosmicus hydrocola TaxID=1826872 RepID=UPI0018C8B4A7|nr:ATP-binding cassette domain-containing protein [Candidatus Nitrosocosmicus hydrocola]
MLLQFIIVEFIDVNADVHRNKANFYETLRIIINIFITSLGYYDGSYFLVLDSNSTTPNAAPIGRNLAIRCLGLSKVYGSQTVVDNLGLEISYGSIFGLLGPNGAGKTTLIKILTGLSKPSSGKAFVAGFDTNGESIKVKENIGWISSEVILDESLTIMENIQIQARLHNIGKDWKDRAISLLNYFELKDTKVKKVEKLSTGMKKKLEIVMALLHKPKILFMDEPTIGLDASTRKLLWKFIRKINIIYGVTIFLTTHYIEEADILCDKIAIINNGKIIATGSPQVLKTQAHGDIIEIEFLSSFDYKKFSSIDGITHIQEIDLVGSNKTFEKPLNNNLKLRIKAKNAETVLPDLISRITECQPNNIETIRIEKPNLESIFLELTGKRFDDIDDTSNNSNNNINSNKKK